MRVPILLLATLASLSASACELPEAERYSFDEATGLSFKFDPMRPVVGEHFIIDMLLCRGERPWSPASLRVDAIMPAHNHGMNYRPGIATDGIGRYTAEGLLLHMPGVWRFHIEYIDGARRGSVEFDYQL